MDVTINIAVASFIVTVLVLLAKISFTAGQQSNQIKNLEDWKKDFTLAFNGAIGEIRSNIDRRMEKLEELIRT